MKKTKKIKQTKNKYSKILISIFAATILIQFLHIIEHIAQVVQKFGLHQQESHGIIGALDLEWVHFIYNGTLLILLYVLAFNYSKVGFKKQSFPLYVFITAVIVESYHMVEHFVKVVQHIETGIQGTPGIVGNLVNPILFHFYINFYVSKMSSPDLSNNFSYGNFISINLWIIFQPNFT